ncbi:hypothetical protein STEG23_035894, partial [Scotinomys teguina]
MPSPGCVDPFPGIESVATFYCWTLYLEFHNTIYWSFSPKHPNCPSSTHQPWDDHQEQQQLWSGAGQSLKDKLYVLQRAELEKRPKPFGRAQKMDLGTKRAGTSGSQFLRLQSWSHTKGVTVIGNNSGGSTSRLSWKSHPLQ